MLYFNASKPVLIPFPANQPEIFNPAASTFFLWNNPKDFYPLFTKVDAFWRHLNNVWGLFPADSYFHRVVKNAIEAGDAANKDLYKATSSMNGKSYDKNEVLRLLNNAYGKFYESIQLASDLYKKDDSAAPYFRTDQDASGEQGLKAYKDQVDEALKTAASLKTAIAEARDSFLA